MKKEKENKNKKQKRKEKEKSNREARTMETTEEDVSKRWPTLRDILIPNQGNFISDQKRSDKNEK